MYYMVNNQSISLGNELSYTFGSFSYNFTGAVLNQNSLQLPTQTFPIDLNKFLYFSIYSHTNITNAYNSYGSGTNYIIIYYFLNSNNSNCFTFSNFLIYMNNSTSPTITEEAFNYNFSFRRGNVYSANAASNTTGGSTSYPSFSMGNTQSVTYSLYTTKNSNSITLDGNITIYYSGIQMIA